MTAKRSADWTREEKFTLVLEAVSVPEAELGAFLRRKGIHEAHLRERRQLMFGALKNRNSLPQGKNTPENRRIRKLESKLSRKEKALAEGAALLVLQKKPGKSRGKRKAPLPGRTASDP